MSDDLEGSIVLSKRIRRNAVWGRDDYAHAWMDLCLLANDRPRTVHINGIRLELKRGQLAWSLRGLGKEWGKGREWVESFMQFCQDAGMLKLEMKSKYTLITVLNYGAYNPLSAATDQHTDPHAEQATDPATDQHSNPATDPQWNREVGMENEKGEGARPGLFEIPSDLEVEDFCGGFEDLSRGIAGIPEVWWRGWLANTLARPHFPPDWKRALKNAFLGDWVARHPKALGQVNGVVKNNGAGNGETVWSLRQRLEVLKGQAASHPANEQSSAYCGEPKAEQLAEYAQLVEQVHELEVKIAGVGN